MDRTLSFHQHRTAMRIGRFGAIELLLSGSRRNRGESPDHAVAGRNIYPQALLWGSPHGCRIGERGGFLGQSQTGSSIAAFNGAGGHLSEAETESGRPRPQNISLSSERIADPSTKPSMEYRHQCAAESGIGDERSFGSYKTGLSQPAYRSRLQTTASGLGQKPWS
jgi:hypothetical protein